MLVASGFRNIEKVTWLFGWSCADCLEVYDKIYDIE